jgi:hypothetical protein
MYLVLAEIGECKKNLDFNTDSKPLKEFKKKVYPKRLSGKHLRSKSCKKYAQKVRSQEFYRQLQK